MVEFATITSVDRKADALQNKIHDLENELRKLQGQPPLAGDDNEPLGEWLSERNRRDSPAMAAVRGAVEQSRQAAHGWLEAAGVPADAHDSLKAFALANRKMDAETQSKFARLAFATSGKEPPVEHVGVRDVVAIWKAIPERLRQPLVDVAGAFSRVAGKYSQSQIDQLYAELE